MNEMQINYELSMLVYPHDVKKLLGIGTTKFYEIAKLPGFPKPRELDGKRNVYLRKEIEDWVNSLAKTEVKEVEEGIGGRYIRKTRKSDIQPSTIQNI